MNKKRSVSLALNGLPFLTVGVIFLGDVVTPTDVSMAPLAAVPVALLAWFRGPALLLILAFATILDSLEVALGATSIQSGAAAVTACVGLAVVMRIASGGRSSGPQPDPLKLPRFLGRMPLGPALPKPVHKPLTRRERQVVELAADGLTAREIGAQLFIGERTVETHLANSYAKLGISSKRELVLERMRSNSA